jgi:hypothetical protein
MELSGGSTKILLWACFHHIDTEIGSDCVIEFKCRSDSSAAPLTE